jgi:hypothetical protein
MHDTMELIQPAQKGLCMKNSVENFYIQLHHYSAILINEENTAEHNFLCDMMYGIQLQRTCI